MKKCKIWNGSTTKAGYGYWVEVHGGRRRWIYAHRVEWESVYGPIPKGMVVMHVCDNPPCYEITHLRLGTQADNMRDMAAKGRWNNQHWNKTHCPEGHEYNEENTFRRDRGDRECRICMNENQRARRKRYRDARNNR